MVETILFENTFWTVTQHGLESKQLQGHYDAHIGQMSKGFSISRDKLESCDWIEDVVAKVWVTPLAFVEAYYAALKLLLGKEYERNVPALLPVFLAEALAGDRTSQRQEWRQLEEILEAEPQKHGPKMLVFVNEQHAARYQRKELLSVL